MSVKQWRWFKDWRDITLKTTRAWAMKEYAMVLWYNVSRIWAEKSWGKWLF